MKRTLCIIIILIPTMIFGAGEITFTGLLKVENGEFSLQRNKNNLKIDQAGTSLDYHIQVIGTNAEIIIVISDVSSNGVSWFRNLTTNAGFFVDIGVVDVNTNFIAFHRLEPTQIAIGTLHPTNDIYAQAASNSVNLEVMINER